MFGFSHSRISSAEAITDGTVVTASGFVVQDAMGWPYEISGAVGNRGGLVAQSLMYMTASGVTPQIRAHFYSQSASGVTAGAANIIDPALHLGFVDHNTWYSAGGGLVMSQVDSPNLALDNISGRDRSIWVVLEARNTAFGFGGSATPLQHKIGVIQD